MDAYTTSELKSAAILQRIQALSAINTKEAQARHLRSVFLSHSHKDRELALGLKGIIEEQGGSLYIDWLDEEMPEAPNRLTGNRIKAKIIECDLFMFLATPSSMVSRWCPWEIGYADGKKPIDNIVIAPTKDDQGRFYGNEYLQLYRRLEPGHRLYGQRPAPTVIRPGEFSGVSVQQL